MTTATVVTLVCGVTLCQAALPKAGVEKPARQRASPLQIGYLDGWARTHYEGAMKHKPKLSMPNSQAVLLKEIEVFLIEQNVSATAFGDDVMGDRHLVKRLRNGGLVKLPTADKLRQYMAAERVKAAKAKKTTGGVKRRPTKRAALSPAL
jgi:hypothetical protein